MSNSDKEYLVRVRGHKRAQVTKYHNKVQDGLRDLDISECHNLLLKLEQLKDELCTLDAKIGSSIYSGLDNKDHISSEFEECDKYNDRIIKTIFSLKNKIEVDSSTNGSNGITGATNVDGSEGSFKFKLPEVPLPYYSHGKDENLDNFFQSFESIIGKFKISNYEKFVLLTKHLKGEPLALVNSLLPDDQSYENAKRLLEQAFACLIVKKFEAIKRLSCLKLEYGGNAYEFVGNMRTVENIFGTLNISVEDVLQYFFWHGMPNLLQTHLMNICNSNRPSLDEIKNNIFPALDRYNESVDKFKKRKDPSKNTVNTFAVDVPNTQPNKSKFCNLCSDVSGSKDSSHATSNCPIYPDSQSKVKKLKDLNGCIKCGYINHITSKCRFKLIKFVNVVMNTCLIYVLLRLLKLIKLLKVKHLLILV